MHSLQQQYFAVREYLAPVLKESKFKERGTITPEEFVAAGDFLTYKFPVWTWEKGDASKARDYLPADKQYLVHRGVACLRRAQSLEYTDADEDAEKFLSWGDESGGKAQEDDWVQTHAGRPVNDPMRNIASMDIIPDVDVGGLSLEDKPNGDAEATPDMDEIPDMEEDGLEAEEDEATAAVKPVSSNSIEVAKGNLLQVRTYDVMITYDKYYQTPRIWLLGYDENRKPLTPQQIFQDVSAEHANKTVTIDPFPHSTSLRVASVHPCKHADVMKKVIERMDHAVQEQQRAGAGPSAASSAAVSKRRWPFQKKEGKNTPSTPNAEGDEAAEGLRVDLYLVVFLKFISSIVPTIEVDSTAQI